MNFKRIFRQRKVLELQKQGFTEQAIADKLGVCRRTISRDKKALDLLVKQNE